MTIEKTNLECYSPYKSGAISVAKILDNFDIFVDNKEAYKIWLNVKEYCLENAEIETFDVLTNIEKATTGKIGTFETVYLSSILDTIYLNPLYRNKSIFNLKGE